MPEFKVIYFRDGDLIEELRCEMTIKASSMKKAEEEAKRKLAEMRENYPLHQFGILEIERVKLPKIILSRASS